MTRPADFSPLRFEPIFQEYLWGGRRLMSMLDKAIGRGPTYAESWELVDHGSHQSQVAEGYLNGESLQGQKLSELVSQFGEEILGPFWYARTHDPSVPPHLQGRFPLLIKWLDAQRDLSIQVHPNDRQAALLDPPDLGKTEAWFIVDALPGAKLYAGVKTGTSQTDLKNALQENRILDVLFEYQPQAGDCFFIPAGTVHALGAGLLVAEVQQASNTTYRMFDWNRLGPDLKPRPLHLAASLEVADVQRGPVRPQAPVEARWGGQICNNTDGSSEASHLQVHSLVAGDYFLIDRVEANGMVSLPSQACQILICWEGRGRLLQSTSATPNVATTEAKNLASNPAAPMAISFQKGDTLLVPFNSHHWVLETETPMQFLVAQLPTAASADLSGKPSQ